MLKTHLLFISECVLSYLLHFWWCVSGRAVLLDERAHVTVDPDGCAVDPLPAAFLQPLEHLPQLRADHQRPLQQRLQVITSDVLTNGTCPGYDELTWSIFIHADGFRLQNAHALHLCHVP